MNNQPGQQIGTYAKQPPNAEFDALTKSIEALVEWQTKATEKINNLESRIAALEAQD